MSWQLRGIDLEFCNCDPGCGCNFRGFPSSPEGNCEAFLCHVVEEGHHGDVDVSGVTIAWALWWPGAIHDKGGRGHAYIDCATDAQFGALSSIARGDWFVETSLRFGGGLQKKDWAFVRLLMPLSRSCCHSDSGPNHLRLSLPRPSAPMIWG